MRSIFVFYMSILCFQVIGQSQSDLNLSAERSYLEKDNELNKIYQEILTEYADDVEFIANLGAGGIRRSVQNNGEYVVFLGFGQEHATQLASTKNSKPEIR